MKIKIRKNVNLAKLSTFKIGGKARFFCEAKNDSELLEAIMKAKELKVPYKIIAGGSNVVFPDHDLNCLLIKIKSNYVSVAGNRIIADAGVELMMVIKEAICYCLKGLETLSGIPGTVGGAIVGNAGACGHSISEVVEKVEIWDGKQKRWIKNNDCKFYYRESIFKKRPYLVLRAVLKFKRGELKKLKAISKNIIQMRLKKYKPSLRCPGSFFKNVLVKDTPKHSLRLIDQGKIIDGKIPAGYLLEMVGAKGMRVGGIKIADFHGNLFINTGKGKTADVKRLAMILKKRVTKKFGINLEEEIRYI